MSRLRFAISLRFTGHDLVPLEISASLGCEPTDSRRKGDDVETERFITKAPTGVWLLEADGSETIDKGIHSLLDRVNNDVAVWSELTKRYRSEFFIGVFSDTGQVGLTIGPEAISRLSRLGLSIGLDIYCNADATT